MEISFMPWSPFSRGKSALYRSARRLGEPPGQYERCRKEKNIYIFQETNPDFPAVQFVA
jgi:hypothetical protein